MSQQCVSKATLGRVPLYLNYLHSLNGEKKNISATFIANALNLGEVQVRKDLSAVSGKGRPKTGYDTKGLIAALEACVNKKTDCQAIIVGAGKLGKALLSYGGFSVYGINIMAAFDKNPVPDKDIRKPIYPMDELEGFCYRNGIKVGIIAVPKESAQQVCDILVKNNITAIWLFAPVDLKVPSYVTAKREDLALSLAHLVNTTV